VPFAGLRRLLKQNRSSIEMARHFNVSRELIEHRLKVCRLWAEYRERHPEEDAARELRRRAFAAANAERNAGAD
jgi:transposase